MVVEIPIGGGVGWGSGGGRGIRGEFRGNVGGWREGGGGADGGGGARELLCVGLRGRGGGRGRTTRRDAPRRMFRARSRSRPSRRLRWSRSARLCWRALPPAWC